MEKLREGPVSKIIVSSVFLKAIRLRRPLMLGLVFLFFASLAVPTLAAELGNTPLALRYPPDLITFSMAAVQQYTRAVFPKLVGETVYLFYFTVLLAITTYIIGMMMNRSFVASSLLFMIGAILSIQLVLFGNSLGAKWFLDFFFFPILNLLQDISGIVISASMNIEGNSLTTALEKVSGQYDVLLTSLSKAKALLAEQTGAFAIIDYEVFWDYVVLWFASITVWLVIAAFAIIYTLALFASALMLMAFPFTVIFYPIPKLRFLLHNNVRAFFNFGLMAPFAAASLSFSSYMVSYYVGQVQGFIENAAATAYPENLLESLILTNLIGWFFILRSSEFASQIVSGVSSNFGTVAAAIGSGAYALSKTASSKASALAAGAALKAVSKIRGG
ncbi:MAG: hypothetical protein ACK5WQ_04150 [Alphaproteobacteria bacterium]